MTVRDILDAARIQAREDIDPIDGVRLVNCAMAEMGNLALTHGAETLLVSSCSEWNNLPADLIQLKQVEDRQRDVILADYRIWGKQIQLPVGDYRLYYLRRPHAVSGLDDTPEVDPLYHPALIAYLASWVLFQHAPASPEGLRLRQDFKDGVAQAYQALVATGQPRTITVQRSVGQDYQRWRGEI